MKNTKGTVKIQQLSYINLPEAFIIAIPILILPLKHHAKNNIRQAKPARMKPEIK